MSLTTWDEEHAGPPPPDAVEEIAPAGAAPGEEEAAVSAPPRRRRRRARAGPVIEIGGAWDGEVPDSRAVPVEAGSVGGSVGAEGPVVARAPGSGRDAAGALSPTAPGGLSPRAARAARAQIARGIQQVIVIGSALVARRVGPEWVVTADEGEALGAAWAACVPDTWLQGAQSPVWAASLLTVAVVGPRAYVTWERRRGGGPPAPDGTTTGEG